MKRLTGLLLAFLLVMQVAAYSRHDAFTDMTGHEYYAEPAVQLLNLGIIGGYEDGTLRADRAVTRAEMATFICRLLGAEGVAQKKRGTTTDLTTDVAAHHWASGYVAFAVENGIVNGDGNGKFRPEDKVRYQEAVKMLVCAVGLEDSVETVKGDWAAGYMNKALDVGILNNVLYDGGDYSNRSDVIMMLYNAITYVDFDRDAYKEPEYGGDADEGNGGYDEESAFEQWDKYEHYDENGNFITYTLTIKLWSCDGPYERIENHPPGTNVVIQTGPDMEDFVRWEASAGKLHNPEERYCIFSMPDEDVVISAIGGTGDYEQDYEEESDFTDLENEVIRLVNVERKKLGLNELVRDEALCKVASAHSLDMYDRNYFDHTNPDGESPFDRMRNNGIFFMAAAENIAKGQSSAQDVMNAWMNSPGHKANILSKNLKRIGVGICKISYGYIWTQCFTD